MRKAYLPAEGSATNGKVWPTWLGVPEVSRRPGPVDVDARYNSRIHTRTTITGGHS